MKDLISCCGIDCEKCDARIATINDDYELKVATAKKFSEMSGTDVYPTQINCTGCRVKGPKTPFCEDMCEIRKCVHRKRYSYCGDCYGFEGCDKLQVIIGTNEEALRTLQTREIIKSGNGVPFGLLIGLIAGLAIGIFVKNCALWLPLGLTIGLAGGLLVDIIKKNKI